MDPLAKIFTDLSNTGCQHSYQPGIAITKDYSEERGITFGPFHGIPVITPCLKCKYCGRSITNH